MLNQTRAKTALNWWVNRDGRLWSLVLHDLQGLGSLTTIWRSFSGTWDN
jgi:hypothetical protein